MTKVMVQGVPHWVVDGRMVPVIAGGDDAAAPAPAPAAAPKADGQSDAPAKDAPWNAEFTKRGISDPAFHQYMQEVAQPYATKLEQQLSQYTTVFDSDDKFQAVQELLTDLNDSPEDVIRTLMEIHQLDPSVFADGAADDDGDAGSAGDDNSPGTQDTAGDPELDQVKQWARSQQQQQKETADAEAYKSYVEEVSTDVGEGFDEELLRMAVITSNGDPKQARALYDKLHEQYVGQSVAGQAKDKPAGPNPLGTDPAQSGRPAPREAKRYPTGRKGIEQLVGDALAEL